MEKSSNKEIGAKARFVLEIFQVMLNRNTRMDWMAKKDELFTWCVQKAEELKLK
jgi:hypothetical protein